MATVRDAVRKVVWKTGKIVTSKGEIPEGQGLEYRDYFDYTEPVSQIPPHRVLAINRGDKEGPLKVKLEVSRPDVEAALSSQLPLEGHPQHDLFHAAAIDALDRLILPSMEREVRRDLTEAAEKHAVEVFARNLGSLLLQPPIPKQVVLAIDPGFKIGCKVAVLDPGGQLLDQAVIYPHPPRIAGPRPSCPQGPGGQAQGRRRRDRQRHRLPRDRGAGRRDHRRGDALQPGRGDAEAPDRSLGDRPRSSRREAPVAEAGRGRGAKRRLRRRQPEHEPRPSQPDRAGRAGGPSARNELGARPSPGPDRPSESAPAPELAHRATSKSPWEMARAVDRARGERAAPAAPPRPGRDAAADLRRLPRSRAGGGSASPTGSEPGAAAPAALDVHRTLEADPEHRGSEPGHARPYARASEPRRTRRPAGAISPCRTTGSPRRSERRRRERRRPEPRRPRPRPSPSQMAERPRRASRRAGRDRRPVLPTPGPSRPATQPSDGCTRRDLTEAPAQPPRPPRRLPAAAPAAGRAASAPGQATGPGEVRARAAAGRGPSSQRPRRRPRLAAATPPGRRPARPARLRHRQRGRRQRLLDQPGRPRRAARVRRHAPRAPSRSAGGSRTRCPSW